MYIVFWRNRKREKAHINCTTNDSLDWIKETSTDEPDKWQYSRIYQLDIPTDAFVVDDVQPLPALKPVDDEVGKIAAALDQAEAEKFIMCDNCHEPIEEVLEGACKGRWIHTDGNYSCVTNIGLDATFCGSVTASRAAIDRAQEAQ